MAHLGPHLDGPDLAFVPTSAFARLWTALGRLLLGLGHPSAAPYPPPLIGGHVLAGYPDFELGLRERLIKVLEW